MRTLRDEIDDHDDDRTQRGRLRHEPLALVPASTPTVVRSFADDEETVLTWSRLRRVARRVPAGLVHAAELEGEAALCGAPLSSLREFGRSRYAFERFAHQDRCRVCDDAAGNPSA